MIAGYVLARYRRPEDNAHIKDNLNKKGKISINKGYTKPTQV